MGRLFRSHASVLAAQQRISGGTGTLARGLQVTGLFLTGLARGLAMNAGSLWTEVQQLDTAVVGSIAQAWQPPPPPYTTPSLPPLYLNQSSSDGFPNHVDP